MLTENVLLSIHLPKTHKTELIHWYINRIKKKKKKSWKNHTVPSSDHHLPICQNNNFKKRCISHAPYRQSVYLSKFLIIVSISNYSYIKLVVKHSALWQHDLNNFKSVYVRGVYFIIQCNHTYMFLRTMHTTYNPIIGS